MFMDVPIRLNIRNLLAKLPMDLPLQLGSMSSYLPYYQWIYHYGWISCLSVCHITNGYTITVGFHVVTLATTQKWFSSQNVYLFYYGLLIRLLCLATMDCLSDREDLRRPRLEAE